MARGKLSRRCAGSCHIPWGATGVRLDDDARIWLERMASRGWTVPTWPRQYGGAELTPAQYLVLLEELRRSMRARRSRAVG